MGPDSQMAIFKSEYIFLNISKSKMNQRLKIGPLAVIYLLKSLNGSHWTFGAHISLKIE